VSAEKHLEGREQRKHQDQEIASISRTPFYQRWVRGSTGYAPRDHHKGTLCQEPCVKSEDLFMEKYHFRKTAYLFGKFKPDFVRKNFVRRSMGVGSGGQGHGLPWIFIHRTDIVNRGLIVLFLVFLLFFGIFSGAPSGIGLKVPFFSLFCYFSIFFPLAPEKIFLRTPSPTWLNRSAQQRTIMVGAINWIVFIIRVLVEKHINGPRPFLISFCRRPCSAPKNTSLIQKNECNTDSWIFYGFKSFQSKSSLGMFPLNISYLMWTSWKPRLQSHVLCRMHCDAIDHTQSQTFLSQETYCNYDETVVTRNQVKYRRQFI